MVLQFQNLWKLKYNITIASKKTTINKLIDFINSDDFPKPKLLEDVLEIAKGDPIFVKGEKLLAVANK